MNWLWVHNKGI